LSWRPHGAVVHLWEPENRDAVVVQRIVIGFRAHVDDVGDARTRDLINVGLGQDFSANGNTFGHEIERYAHKRLARSDSVTSVRGPAAEALGRSTNHEVFLKKRALSAAGRAAIVKAAKKRWAKVRKQAMRAVSEGTSVSRQVPTSSLEVLVIREVVVASP
jgi:hypothetical protein